MPDPVHGVPDQSSKKGSAVDCFELGGIGNYQGLLYFSDQSLLLLGEVQSSSLTHTGLLRVIIKLWLLKQK